MKARPSLAGAGVIFLAAMAVTGPIAAQQPPPPPPTAAEALVRQGIEFRRQGNDEEALKLFRAAYDMAPSARSRAQIGLAEQALGRWAAAEKDLTLALGESSDPWVIKNSVFLKRSLEVVSNHLGTLEVISSVDGAEVLVNGQPLGKTPLVGPLRVDVGTTILELRAPGHHTVTRTVAVAAGKLARETVALYRVAAPGESGPSPSPIAVPARPIEKPKPNRPLRRLAWSATTVSAAFLVLGGVAIGLREHHASHFNDNSACLGTGKTRIQNCRSDNDAVVLTETLAKVGFITSGAFAAGAVVLFIISTPRERPVSIGAFGLGCGRGPGEVGVACGGRF